MREIDYIELGATLFIPATHKDLLAVVSGVKYKNLKSVLIDFEDSVKDDEILKAMQNFDTLFEKPKKYKKFIFIRPRNVEMLKKLLIHEHISAVDGFILPKFSLTNAKEYLDILEDTTFFIMPSIEGSELFNQAELLMLKDILLEHKDRIILVRFGLEDMLKQLCLRRKCSESIFDFASTSVVMGNFISIFKSSGFAISGGVYPCFKDSDGFIKDVKRDLKEGLFSKTIIHPSQIELSNELYKVTQKEFDEALEIYESESAIFSQDGKMAEVTTMSPWAENIIKRAEVYGVY